MKSTGSRPAYEARMHRVLEHIDRHLNEALDLEALAEVANFSPFHFHRLFAAWTGERFGDYVRRRRLENAAVRLMAQPRSAVLDIALAVGFGSAEAFARAFKIRFGASPTAWRAQQAHQRRQMRNPDQVVRKFDQGGTTTVADHGGPFHSRHRPAMNNVRLIDRTPVTIAYLRHHGPYGAGIGQFWGEVAAPWLATNGLLGRARYGVSHDDPSIVEPSKCRYDAGVDVPPGFVPTAPALTAVLPGGRYAALAFHGGNAQIGAAWDALLRDWLPASGLQLDARPCFEHYPVTSTWDPESGAFECELCIPVMPL